LKTTINVIEYETNPTYYLADGLYRKKKNGIAVFMNEFVQTKVAKEKSERTDLCCANIVQIELKVMPFFSFFVN